MDQRKTGEITLKIVATNSKRKMKIQTNNFWKNPEDCSDILDFLKYYDKSQTHQHRWSNWYELRENEFVRFCVDCHHVETVKEI